MFGKGAVHVTLSLSLLTRIACAAAVAALLLLPTTGAWAADEGLNWSNNNNQWNGPAPGNGYSSDHNYQAGEYSADNDATGANVTIDTGGSDKFIYGGYSYNDTAKNNTVTMTGGEADDLYGGYSYNGDASENTVIINGGKVNDNIYGGFAPTTTKKAENNTVILAGKPNFGNVLMIFGGHATYASDCFIGNTLKLGSNALGGYKGIDKVSRIESFQYFEFTLEADSKPLKVINMVFGDSFGIKSEVKAINTIGSYDPQRNVPIPLIEADNIERSDIEEGEVTGEQLGGANAATYKWNVQIVDSKKLVATLLESVITGIKPQTKSLLEGRMGGTVALTQAADMTAGQGMSAMLASVSQSSFSTWGAIGGGTSRYNTGSHINSDGIGFMIGAAWRKCTGPGTLALSPFFAFGWGNYTSHNAFSGVGSVKGKGNTNYQGGGLMARYGHTNTGWYGEASLSLGHVKQDYKSSDFLDNYLNDTKYAINQMYTSMHIGIGKEIALSNCSVLDVYGKYFWTHTGKKDRDIAGDRYKFAAVNSHRARFGARYTYTAATGSGEVKPYAGAAYEYEFNGKGRGTANGFRIADTRLQGSTDLLEAGIDYAPNSKKWALNAGATGFVGKRRGIMGQLGVRADF